MKKRARWLVMAPAALLLLVLLQPVLLGTELALIDVYQRVGSPTVGVIAACRFEMTCSHYAGEALRREGLWVGNWRIAGRLARCSGPGRMIDWAVGD